MVKQVNKLPVEGRKLIIKLFKKGRNQDEIAEIVDCNQSTVCKWIKAYKNGRTDFEDRLREGRPTNFKGHVLRTVRKKLMKKIKSANEKFGHISTKECKEIIETETGKTYSTRHVERIMHKLGFSLIKPRRQHIKKNQKRTDSSRKNLLKKTRHGTTWGMS